MHQAPRLFIPKSCLLWLGLFLTLLIQAQPLVTHEDESKVPSYKLPPLLNMENGMPVQTESAWVHFRRPELLEMFTHQMYGAVPDGQVSVSAEVLSEEDGLMDGMARSKQVVLRFTREGSDSSAEVHVLIYSPITEKAVPAFLGLNFYGNHAITADKGVRISTAWMRDNPSQGVVNHRATEASRGGRSSRWPIETIMKRGYGLVTAYYGDIDPDFDDGWKNGIHPLFYRQRQQAPEVHQWGSIAAWAWGLSRILDHLELEPLIDHHRIAVMGHSRLGKTALWAGATDPRFAMVISNNSGCGGAALSRRAYGETVRQINSSFPHWFCDAFTRFNDRESVLPFDQHQLIALMAPRPVYVASAVEDQWADPKGEFLSAKHASEVYRLLGVRGIEVDQMPDLNHPVGSRVRFHIRSGKHDVTDYDWEQYLRFADEMLSSQ